MKQQLLHRIVVALWTAAVCTVASAQEKPVDCHVGAYRLDDKRVLDIGTTADGGFRWRLRDGTTGALKPTAYGSWTSTVGWTTRADGTKLTFDDCASETISFNQIRGQRIDFDVTDTTFVSESNSLAGRLVLPQGAGKAPIVVLLHGSESDSALNLNSLQRRLPAEGVGVFVYDKRGTGKSQGKYSQDFELLAADAVAALSEARRLAGPHAGRIGFQGPSQGGWVAPIAARRSRVDFVIVGFGLAVSVLEEDRSAVALNMRMKGHGPDVLAKALEVADASGAVASRGAPEDYERLDQVKQKYHDQPWLADVHGNFTFFLLAKTSDEIRKNRQVFEAGTPWHYDPLQTIANVQAPQLWVLAEDDVDAPSAETARRLDQLRKKGRPITTVIYPLTEHGIFEYETAADGERFSTRQPGGYLDLMIGFAREGRLPGQYGTARIGRPKR